MFLPIIEKIEQRLTDMGIFRTVGIWQGDVKDLLENMHQLPSVHILFSVAEFDESRTIRGELPPHEDTWTLLVMTEDRSNRKAGALQSLGLLGKLVALHEPDSEIDKGGLTRFDVGQGRLWPAIIQLLGTKDAKAVYGVKFYNKKGH
jgi:hypothetical protein